MFAEESVRIGIILTMQQHQFWSNWLMTSTPEPPDRMVAQSAYPKGSFTEHSNWMVNGFIGTVCKMRLNVKLSWKNSLKPTRTTGAGGWYGPITKSKPSAEKSQYIGWTCAVSPA